MKSTIKILIGILILTILVCGFNGCVPKEAEKAEEKVPEILMPKEITNVTISIIYDNYAHNPELETAWGISCLIEIPNKSILFDTGGDSPTLLDNMEKLGIDPKTIDIVALSHIHGDHVGGLSGFLECNPNVTVYIPASFPDSFRNNIRKVGAQFVDVSTPIKIANGISTTGELEGPPKEQSLFISTPKGLVVITGCAHPGVVNIVRKAKELTNESIYLVLGGFHLGGASDATLRGIITDFRQLGVKKVAPSHCSGDRTRQLFREEYGNDYIESGVGKVFEI